MSLPVQLYTRDTIAGLDWPATSDGTYARRFLLPFIEQSISPYIQNVYNTRLAVAQAGGLVLPVTVTDFHPENAYTCSPYNHYIAYGGFEELPRLKKPLAETLLKVFLRPLAWYLRHSGFDRVAFVNNWLLSTNLYPALVPAEVKALAETLPQMFPDRAIVFRSVDAFQNPGLYQTLLVLGYRMVLSRQVWYQSPSEAYLKKNVKMDLSLFHHSPYEAVDGKELTDEEIGRAVELYTLLYIQKYSRFNPQFTRDFFRLALERNLLHFRALRRDGQLNGIMGYFVRNGVMTPPVFGYDTHLPQKEGLYRWLSILTLQEGLKHKLTVHASAGVGAFKKLRGGRPVIEYNAVYDRHLNLGRRAPWALLKALSEIAIPIFQKYEF